jgi:integrase/recombinase XerD
MNTKRRAARPKRSKGNATSAAKVEEAPASRGFGGYPGSNSGSRPSEALTSAEVKQLMAAMNNGATGQRNRALVAVLYRAGLRISEALALRPSDIDTKAGEIAVRHGKGDKARIVGIDDGGLRYVERWLTRRGKLGLRNGRLFCQLDGTPMTPQAARAMLNRAAKKAGIDKAVRPHGLRHSYAAELARERVPVVHIQNQLGHSDLSVTTAYLRSIAPAESIAAVRARTWDDEDAE